MNRAVARRPGAARVAVRVAAGVALLVAALALAPAAARAHDSAPASLRAPCLRMTGAGHASCATAVASAAGVGVSRRLDAADAIGLSDVAGAYSLYRLVSATEDHRGCRLQPTCSLFAVRAVRRAGLWRGLLMAFARPQMEHADQGGLLPRVLASDGDFIYLDPVERWLRAGMP